MDKPLIEKRQHGEHDNHQSDEINDIVHGIAPAFESVIKADPAEKFPCRRGDCR
jgi:hypothetical protein